MDPPVDIFVAFPFFFRLRSFSFFPRITTLCVIVLCYIAYTYLVLTSVTRCWCKKQPNFLQKFPKKYPHQFNIKSAIIHNSDKYIQATFARNFVRKNFQKSPNLVTTANFLLFLKMGCSLPLFTFPSFYLTVKNKTCQV